MEVTLKNVDNTYKSVADFCMVYGFLAGHSSLIFHKDSTRFSTLKD